MGRRKKVKSIVIIGRLWFGRTNGNTYHSSTIVVDGKLAHRTGRAYGYGDQYEETAAAWLEAHKIIPEREEGRHGKGAFWRHLEELGIQYFRTGIHVSTEKEL